MLKSSISAFDVVDGTHSAASKCHRVVASKRNHIEGAERSFIADPFSATKPLRLKPANDSFALFIRCRRLHW